MARKQADEIKKRVPWMGRRAWGVIYEHQRQYNKAEYEYLSALLETKEIKHPTTRFAIFIAKQSNLRWPLQR